VKLTKKNGFTVIELMIVIGIIAVLTTIAVTNFRIYTRNNALQSAARALAGDIQIIRQRAMADSPVVPYTLQFLNATQYTYTLPPNPAVIKDVTTFFPDILFNPNPTFVGNVITFQSRGSINFGTVTLTNNRGSTVTLTASPPIGRINVQNNMQ
jgi:prepilin-type N-terminal cleavage/methylation domain-containing protein